MSSGLENRIRDVISTVQKIMSEHSDMAKKRIKDVAVRRIMDIIKEEMDDLKKSQTVDTNK